MSTHATEFWNRYSQLVKRIMPPLKAQDGASEADIQATETRLGFTLPEVLRQFYRRTGERSDINAVFHRLRPLKSLIVTHDKLTFYEENQSACAWSIDIGRPVLEDPPVFRQDSTSNPQWEIDFECLSEFLVGMLFLQAVNGGMRYVGVGSFPGLNERPPTPEWEVIAVGCHWNNTILMRDGQVLDVYGNEPAPEVFGGAKSKRKFLEMERTFDIDWDYCTLDDE